MHRRGAAWFGAPGFLSTCHLQGSTKIRGVKRRDHGRRGELTAGYREGQEEKLSALGLMLNVIAFWNATYMQAVVENLQAHGRSVNPAELARVSPLAHRHINFLGRYAFTLPEATPAENSGLCATPIPNRIFATPYVSRPFLSHARSVTGPVHQDIPPARESGT